MKNFIRIIIFTTIDIFTSWKIVFLMALAIAMICVKELFIEYKPDGNAVLIATLLGWYASLIWDVIVKYKDNGKSKSREDKPEQKGDQRSNL